MIENNFRIVIPVYNSENWITRCIWSLEQQRYGNWKGVIINDASTDNTYNVILNKLRKVGHIWDNLRFFNRITNVGALENIVYGINSICFDDEDIIVLLDGDDAFFANDVLDHLNDVYQDPNILVTYGQYRNESNAQLGNNKLLTVSTREYRMIKNGPLYWCTSHLRTFKYKLWKKIFDGDLRDWNGNYFAMAWDMAIMYPLIEMSGNHRIKYIDKVMYLYNDLNPINDFKKNINLQIQTANYIKSKLRYRILRNDEL